METGKGEFFPGPGGDDILREVWAAKDALSASYGHDLDRLVEITRAHEEESRLAGRRIVDLSGGMASPKQP